MNKGVGYALTLVGLGVLTLGIKPVQTALKLTLPSFLSPTTLMILGAIIAVIGILLVKKASSVQQPEVPIYDPKNNIVGYRKVV
ncbi:hypothetical protein EXS73_01985 [Candidatus Pacearchaeota archaeon]|nr:hypothetical protein [Candidatus Pacearchaeota archaeon]